MSARDPAPHTSSLMTLMRGEIAHTLVGAMRAAIATPTDPGILGRARDAAQLLGLKGLERLLGAFALHVGRPLPTEFAPVVGRLLRLTDECDESGDTGVFGRVDRELSALAAELEGLEWSEVDGEGG